MSIIKSRHTWTLLLLLTAFFVPWGQSQAGSNIASRTLLSSDGNRLTGVTESVADYDFTGSFEYKRLNGSQYIYNGNGSLVADRSRGIAYIAYDLNNNPSRIYFTNGNEIRYTYSSTGEKLCAKYYNAVPNVTREFGVEPEGYPQSQIMAAYQYDYLLGGNLVMYNGMIDKVLFDGGYFKGTPISSGYGFTLYYYNKDHLGNNREVVNAAGTVQQVTNYYPFGAPYADPNAVVNASYQPYKYNGKELDLMHGLNTYDYGARQYDPILARWDRVDPLAEKYYSTSPYAYCENDPVNKVDPDGRKIVFVNGKIGGGSPAAGAQYWNGTNSTFVQGAKQFFNDQNVSFTNRDYGYLSSASQRRKEGYEYAKSTYSDWVSSMQPDESFKLVSHSMGGAFSMGIEDYIKERGRMVDYNVMINTYQVDKINVDKSSTTFYVDYQNTNDPVLFWFDINLGRGELKNADMKIRENSSDDLYYIHRSPIDTGDFWMDCFHYFL